MSNFQGNRHMFLTDCVLNVSYQHKKDSLVSGAFSSRLHCNKTWIKRMPDFLKCPPRSFSALELGTHTWFYDVASP